MLKLLRCDRKQWKLFCSWQHISARSSKFSIFSCKNDFENLRFLNLRFLKNKEMKDCYNIFMECLIRICYKD